MEKKLTLYKLMTDGSGRPDRPFPLITNPVTLNAFTYEANRMGGAPTISGTAYHSDCLDNKWDNNVYVEFNGEKYYIKNVPTSSKSNEDGRYKYEIELKSEREILDHVYFIDAVQEDGTADKYKSNTTKVIFMGNIQEYVARLNACFAYHNLDYSVVIDEGVTTEEKQVSFKDKYISEALQEGFTIYEVPYYYVGKVIHFGYTDDAIPYIMKYDGIDGALLAISKENANYDFYNKLKGIGSSDNIPYYYPNDSDDREAIEAAGGKWITPMENLMPPIYRESNGAEQFYEAKNNTYKIPDDEGYYVFENEYSEGNPRQGSQTFEDIKPTIKGMTNAQGLRMDMFSEFAYDENDNDEIDEDTNEYIHPYFFGKLRKFDGDYGFNLFEQASEADTMQFSFTSGVCGACNFELGVGEETKKNIVQVDDNGNLKRDAETGEVIRTGNPQDRQNDTQHYEVWIALKKDASTYGQVMPNAHQNLRPSADDTFVILNINLPKAYILKAEDELKEAIIKYMYMNNSEKFNFSIKFSRIFFEENPEILEQLNENSRIIVEYNNIQHTFYIDSYTYKMEESAILPEISVNLVDTLTVGQNSLQTKLDSVKQDILSSIGGQDFLKQGLKYFIRKDVKDYALDFITFYKGLVLGNYTPNLRGGVLKPDDLSEIDSLNIRKALKIGLDVFGQENASIDENGNAALPKITASDGLYSDNFTTGSLGAGFCLKKQDDNGDSYLEIDRMLVRKVATFIQLLIQEVKYAGGQIILSPASMICSKVEEYDSHYRCYFDKTDGDRTINQEFVAGDQARFQTFNLSEGNAYYWRLVTNVGDDYIDLSKTDCDANSTVPQAGDNIVQLGNRIKTDRQNAIILSSYGGYDAPYIKMYRGIMNYSLDGKEFISLSWDSVDITANNIKFVTGEDVKVSLQLLESGLQSKVSQDDLETSVIEIADGVYTKQSEYNEAITSIEQSIDSINISASETNKKVTEIEDEVTSLDTRISEAEIALQPDNIWIGVREKSLELASYAGGEMLYRDPTFRDGNNEIGLYDLSGNNNVSLERTNSITGNPNNTGYGIKITCIGEANPYWGGFWWGTLSSANKVYITRIVAKIPIGYKLGFRTNAVGNNSTQEWLTSVDGTGDWYEYIFRLKCGGTGDFSTTNYFYLYDGTTPTASAPLIWYLSFATVYDVTGVDNTPTEEEIKAGINIDAFGIDVFGKNINFAGTVTFGSLASDAQDKINNAQTTADSAITAVSDSKEDIAKNLGYESYSDLTDKAEAGKTIINNGSINTNLITVDTILAEKIGVASITTGKITVTDGAKIGNFVVENNIMKMTAGVTGIICGTGSMNSEPTTDLYAEIGTAGTSAIAAGCRDNKTAVSINASGSSAGCIHAYCWNVGGKVLDAVGGCNWQLRSGDTWNMPGVLCAARISISSGGVISMTTWGDGLGALYATYNSYQGYRFTWEKSYNPFILATAIGSFSSDFYVAQTSYFTSNSAIVVFGNKSGTITPVPMLNFDVVFFGSGELFNN